MALRHRLQTTRLSNHWHGTTGQNFLPMVFSFPWISNKVTLTYNCLHRDHPSILSCGSCRDTHRFEKCATSNQHPTSQEEKETYVSLVGVLAN